ncbi:MAG: archaeosortase/exosortase family protein [Balneola sp.]
MKSPLVIFIIKSLGFFIIWYIIYELWLLPDGSLDEFISLNVIGISKGLLESMSFEIFSYSRVIGIFGNPGVEIVDGCNGIAAMGLFFGFMIAYPGEIKKKLSFSILGIGLIYISNIIRIIALVYTQDAKPEIFNFFHDYTTTAIFYFIIFGLWMIWVNYSSKELTYG